MAALLQMPSASGLFHRAVIQSGIIRAHSGNEEAPDMVELLLNKLGITPERIREIEEVPYYRFQQIISAVGPHAYMNFGPKSHLCPRRAK